MGLKSSIAGVIFLVFIFTSSVAAWLTHIITCFIDGSWGFLIAGAIFFPIAVIHGWLIWFGIV